jgi:hypothetical protein
VLPLVAVVDEREGGTPLDPLDETRRELSRRKKRRFARGAPKRQNGYVARPSSLTADRREAAERALTAGLPLSVAAASADVSPRTISRWLQDGLIVRRHLAAAPEPPPAEPAPPEPDVEKVLVGVVLRAARDDWRAAIALLRWRELRRRSVG